MALRSPRAASNSKAPRSVGLVPVTPGASPPSHSQIQEVAPTRAVVLMKPKQRYLSGYRSVSPGRVKGYHSPAAQGRRGWVGTLQIGSSYLKQVNPDRVV